MHHRILDYLFDVTINGALLEIYTQHNYGDGTRKGLHKVALNVHKPLLEGDQQSKANFMSEFTNDELITKSLTSENDKQTRNGYAMFDGVDAIP